MKPLALCVATAFAILQPILITDCPCDFLCSHKNAIEAVRKWEFEPTLVNGVPTPIVVPATVTFSTQ